MTSQATVWSFGSMLVDLTVEVGSLPPKGGDVIASAYRVHAGGGFNLAAAAARQGVPVRYGAPLGAGPYADIIAADLSREGIVAHHERRRADNGFCLVFVEPDAERTFVTMPGIEGQNRPEDLARIEVRQGDIVSISGYDLCYPVSGTSYAAWLPTLASTSDVVLDPGPLIAHIPAEAWKSALQATTVLSLNEREAQLLTGSTLTGSKLAEAVRGAAGPMRVIVRTGANGCWAADTGADPVHVPAPLVEAVDTTGAGDAHTGVLCAWLARKRPFLDAVLAANVAAADSVTRVGPAEAPDASRLATLLARLN